MSLIEAVQLTEEQENFLKSLEEEFKDRYTEKDEDFNKVLNAKPSLPPIVENWDNSRSYDRRRPPDDHRRWDDRPYYRRRDRHWPEDENYHRHSYHSPYGYGYQRRYHN